MALSLEHFAGVKSNEALLALLTDELKKRFPPEIREDPVLFLSRLYAAPDGLHAMAVTYDLDVSMAMDDLAWHFLNHHESLDFAEETVWGLRELGAPEAAAIFREALEIVRPYWDQLDIVTASREWHDWLDSTGIQSLVDPLNDRMWSCLKRFEHGSLMSLWVMYARQNPEKCIPNSECT